MPGASLRLVVLGFAAVLGSVSGLASDPVSPHRDAHTLHAVLDRIAKSYVEPSRVDPRRMLWAAARSLDRDVPEVLLDSDESQGVMTLRVSGERRTFSAEGVRSLRELDATVQDVLRFVGEHRSPSSKPKAEYVAINGILAYFSRPANEPHDHLAVAPDVPLGPGLNAIGICARGKDEERCEKVFVYRVAPPL